jgi:hypothetical protein
VETTNVYSDMLKIAAETVGGRTKLAERLGVRTDELAIWMSDAEPVPLEPFLTALEIIEGGTP